MEGTFSNDDLAIEIFSRLSAKNLSTSKCVSKRWNSLISNPSFLRVHSRRSDGPLGLFFQMYVNNVDYVNKPITYIPLAEVHPKMQETFFDFLPEKVVLMASSNGLLCCRNCIHAEDDSPPVKQKKRSRNGKILKGRGISSSKELVIYVCNPTSKDWIALRPNDCYVGDSFGIAFYPFGFSSNSTPGFILVNIQRSKVDPNTYIFVLYSSETGRWTTSKEVCYCNYMIHKNRQIFVGHRFHWLTRNHHIITFDVERELSGVIKLPGPVMNGEGRWVCLGGSEGYLHYVCTHGSELRVWMLKDYHKPEWMLKHSLNLVDFCIEHSALFSDDLLDVFNEQKCRHETVANTALLPLAFDEEILFMNLERKLHSYSFRTGRLEKHCWTFGLEGYITDMPTVLPHSVCLGAVGVLKEDQSNGAKANAYQSDAISLERPERKKRKTKKLKC